MWRYVVRQTSYAALAALLIGATLGLARPTTAEEAPSCTLMASPVIISPGESASLNWTVDNAFALIIEGQTSLTLPTATGTITIKPTESRAYTARVEGPDGVALCSTNIVVDKDRAIPLALYAKIRAEREATAAGLAMNALSSRFAGSGADLLVPIGSTLASSTLIASTQALLSSGTAPVPLTVTVGASGRVLVRGIVETAGVNTVTLLSWGGRWTVRSNTFGPTTVVPMGPLGSGDLSALRPGDVVGVDGTMDGSFPFTVNAYFVRDWTTNPSER